MLSEHGDCENCGFKVVGNILQQNKEQYGKREIKNYKWEPTFVEAKV